VGCQWVRRGSFPDGMKPESVRSATGGAFFKRQPDRPRGQSGCAPVCLADVSAGRNRSKRERVPQSYLPGVERSSNELSYAVKIRSGLLSGRARLRMRALVPEPRGASAPPATVHGPAMNWPLTRASARATGPPVTRPSCPQALGPLPWPIHVAQRPAPALGNPAAPSESWDARISWQQPVVPTGHYHCSPCHPRGILSGGPTAVGGLARAFVVGRGSGRTYLHTAGGAPARSGRLGSAAPAICSFLCAEAPPMQTAVLVSGGRSGVASHPQTPIVPTVDGWTRCCSFGVSLAPSR